MYRLYAPVAVAVIAIVSLTVWAGAVSDRLGGGSLSAEELNARFAKVPLAVGPWVGKDMIPEKATLEQAGAVDYVSRRYINSETQQAVDLWMIVGHARDICRHTPDICYPSQGFSQLGARVRWSFEMEDGDEEPTFFTAKFRNESEAGNKEVRVFWAWNGNTEGKDTWDAPEPTTWFDWLPFKSTGPKVYYGNNSELYKLYFTAQMDESDEDVEKNVVNEFAALMLPELNKAVFPDRYKSDAKPAATATEEAAAEPAADAAADASEPAPSPAEGAAPDAK